MATNLRLASWSDQPLAVVPSERLAWRYHGEAHIGVSMGRLWATNLRWLAFPGCLDTADHKQLGLVLVLTPWFFHMAFWPGLKGR